MKRLLLFLVLVALVITPLRLSAIEAVREEDGKDNNRENSPDRTRENSQEAAKDQARIASGTWFADDDNSACEASPPPTNHQSS